MVSTNGGRERDSNLERLSEQTLTKRRLSGVSRTDDVTPIHVSVRLFPGWVDFPVPVKFDGSPLDNLFCLIIPFCN